MVRLLLEFLILLSVFFSILVITSKNPVIAVVCLIALFINIAGYLILLGIGFLGLSYIIIYIGAITVLFLFIIMMINIRLVDILEIGNDYTKNLPLALSLGLLFMIEIYIILPFTFNNLYILQLPVYLINNINDSWLVLESLFNPTLNEVFYPFPSGAYLLNFSFNFMDNFIYSFSQIEVLGLILYTSGSVWLFLCGFILLLSMVSAIILSSSRKI